jgi:hypothetical protein
MSEILANELRTQYQKVFRTIRGIAEAFPEARWREPKGVHLCNLMFHHTSEWGRISD